MARLLLCVGVCLAWWHQAGGAAAAAGSGSGPEWKLAWSDEFDRAGAPDPARWSYEQGYIRNRERQYYTVDRRENARVENGLLIIEARKEQYPLPRRARDGRTEADITSASLITKGKGEWTHARVEVRAKLPTGRGTWPAIWMLGRNIDQVGWPRCGEIDIMENVGFDPDRIHANIHTEAYNHVKKTGKGSSIVIERPHADFHVYAIEWLADRIDFFVDGVKYFSYAKESNDEAVWPYDQPHYLILNLAIGGTWGGQKGLDESIFPQRMEVDYVRVYERVKP